MKTNEYTHLNVVNTLKAERAQIARHRDEIKMSLDARMEVQGNKENNLAEKPTLVQSLLENRKVNEAVNL